jgi:hypothetical protein
MLLSACRNLHPCLFSSTAAGSALAALSNSPSATPLPGSPGGAVRAMTLPFLLAPRRHLIDRAGTCRPLRRGEIHARFRQR